jgi:hypothetical protein
VPNESRVTINTTVLLFSLAVSVLTGIMDEPAPAVMFPYTGLAPSQRMLAVRTPATFPPGARPEWTR